MTTDISPQQKTNLTRGMSFWSGLLLVGLGIAGLVLPNIATGVVETWISLLLIFAAGAKLSNAFGTREQEGFVWKLLLGILYLATGVMLLIYPRTGILSLTLLLGSFLLTEGVFELFLAFKVRNQPNWTWVLINGILTLVLGAMVWFGWPFNAPWLLGTLVGVSVLFTGVSRTMLSLNMSDSNTNQPDPAASI
ncbi:hypothetical protein C7H19_06715 [Aphanothece hegewaldii CCALA 016]|uniref:HdeD family acid-resistance protein n=1 Tax=Aphanothece hegewaldii CCALA 016 TaxID=2107694 RepID=A0A2T1M0G3_9CHRO|nr:DUF308 domain-containing protein [Aphanothece hegewaldii]PSF38158.1 hypothetical protein C7H19_06715 [Aphanothece hegewaldii CCALA 016]